MPAVVLGLVVQNLVETRDQQALRVELLTQLLTDENAVGPGHSTSRDFLENLRDNALDTLADIDQGLRALRVAFR